jgi:GNAT superfamily N-acetyltransferase
MLAKRFWNALNGERNRFFFQEWTLEPLCPSISLKQFDCGDTDLNEFFRIDAVKNEKELLGKTYLLTRDSYQITEKNPPVALICYCNDSIHVNLANDFERLEGVNYYEYLPAAKIARLAVHKDFQGDDIGDLVLTMTKSIFLTQNRTGCRILTVDAYKRDYAVKFYEDNGFRRISESKRELKASTWTMYYDLKRFQDPGIFF